MKNNLLLFLAFLGLASCKKDDPAVDTTPILTIKWTFTKETQTVKKYRNGLLTETKTNTENYTDNEFWDFKTNGVLMVTSLDNTVTGQASYNHTGDSLIIEPGNIFGARIRAKISGFTRTDISLSYISVATVANGVDSFFIKSDFYKPSN